MSTDSVKANANVIVARRALDSLQSGGLVRHAVRPQYAASEMSTDSVKALNGTARGVMDSLQSGGLLQGTVRSLSSVGGIDVAWVAIELPMLGERQILVREEQELRIGQEVAIECVPNVSKPARYVFRMANGAFAPAAGTSEPSRH